MIFNCKLIVRVYIGTYKTYKYILSMYVIVKKVNYYKCKGVVCLTN